MSFSVRYVPQTIHIPKIYAIFYDWLNPVISIGFFVQSTEIKHLLHNSSVLSQTRLKCSNPLFFTSKGNVVTFKSSTM